MDEDVNRILGLGFKQNAFVNFLDGFKVLKNSSEGRCVFHDGKRCTIYENRPVGCKLYPVIFDEDLNLPVKDKLCPFQDEFDLSSGARNELWAVYMKLNDERQAPIRKSDKL